jgi:hypothetical protein
MSRIADSLLLGADCFISSSSERTAVSQRMWAEDFQH